MPNFGFLEQLVQFEKSNLNYKPQNMNGNNFLNSNWKKKIFINIYIFFVLKYIICLTISLILIILIKNKLLFIFYLIEEFELFLHF